MNKFQKTLVSVVGVVGIGAASACGTTNTLEEPIVDTIEIAEVTATPTERPTATPSAKPVEDLGADEDIIYLETEEEFNTFVNDTDAELYIMVKGKEDIFVIAPKTKVEELEEIPTKEPNDKDTSTSNKETVAIVNKETSVKVEANTSKEEDNKTSNTKDESTSTNKDTVTTVPSTDNKKTEAVVENKTDDTPKSTPKPKNGVNISTNKEEKEALAALKDDPDWYNKDENGNKIFTDDQHFQADYSYYDDKGNRVDIVNMGNGNYSGTFMNEKDKSSIMITDFDDDGTPIVEGYNNTEKPEVSQEPEHTFTWDTEGLDDDTYYEDESFSQN